jgi:hypothetical protein
VAPASSTIGSRSRSAARPTRRTVGCCAASATRLRHGPTSSTCTPSTASSPPATATRHERSVWLALLAVAVALGGVLVGRLVADRMVAVLLYRRALDYRARHPAE